MPITRNAAVDPRRREVRPALQTFAPRLPPTWLQFAAALSFVGFLAFLLSR